MRRLRTGYMTIVRTLSGSRKSGKSAERIAAERRSLVPSHAQTSRPSVNDGAGSVSDLAIEEVRFASITDSSGMHFTQRFLAADFEMPRRRMWDRKWQGRRLLENRCVEFWLRVWENGD